MKRASWKIIGMAALVLVAAVPAPPASAADKAGGVIAFEGQATLGNFPCPPPQPGQFPCEGTWSGLIGGSLSGVHTRDGEDEAWAVEILIPDAEATIAYFDLVQPGVPCSEGFARATGEATGTINEVFGAYGNQLPVPAPVTGIKITWKFDWRRVGVNGLMRFTEVQVTLNVLGIAEPLVVIANGIGNGAATFVPAMEAAHLAGCETGDPPDPADDMNATIVGQAAFADID